jgi:sulfite exporter TauE/SafE
MATKMLLGFLAGLSVGVSCLGLCLPVFLPILLSQKRNTKGSFLLVLEFSGGRLLGYLFFGLVFGLFGQLIRSNLIHYIIAIANIWTGILMIVYSLGRIDKKICSYIPFSKIKWPILLGFLTGVNVCPPFLASLTYVFNLRDIILSLIYFLMFFLGTSVYIVPAAFLGIFTKINWVQKISHIAGVLVGIYFTVWNLLNVW